MRFQSLELGDAARDPCVQPRPRIGMEHRLNFLQQRARAADECLARLADAVELAVLTVQSVAADDRHLALAHVAPADLDDHRRALLDPTPALDRSLGGSLVEQHPHRLAQRSLPRQRRLQFGTIGHQRLILGHVAQHRHDHHLPRRDARRHAQAVIVAMHHDQPADHPR